MMIRTMMRGKTCEARRCSCNLR